MPGINAGELNRSGHSSERDAALWWRFYFEDERPYFIPPPVKPLRAETERHWLRQMWLGQTAFDQGLFSEAEEHFRDASLEVEKLGNKSHLATTLRCLGRSLCAQDKHEAAEPLYKKAVEIHGQSSCPSSIELEDDFDAFVRHYRMQGKYSEAENLIRSVLDKLEKSENNASLLSRYLNNLAVLLCEEGRCMEAEPIYRRVLEITKTFTGARIISYVLVLLNLAVLCFRNERMDEARELYDKAVKTLQLVPDHQMKVLDDYQQVFRGLSKTANNRAPLGEYLHASIPPQGLRRKSS